MERKVDVDVGDRPPNYESRQADRIDYQPYYMDGEGDLYYIPPENAPDDPNDPDPSTVPLRLAQRRSRKRRWCIALCIVFSVIFVVLAVTLPVLFLVRRDVTFDIEPPAVENSTVNVDPSGFTIPIDPTVHATNKNYFDVLLTSIFVAANHPSYANGSVPLGTGTLNDVNLPKRSTIDFRFPFVVAYNRANDPNFAYFGELLQNCTQPEAKLYLSVPIDVQYHVWAKSGTMQDERIVYVSCPVSPQKARSLLALLS